MSKETGDSTPPFDKEKADALYAEIEDTCAKIQAALDDDSRIPTPFLWMKKMEAQQEYLSRTGAPHPRHTTHTEEQRLVRITKSVIAKNIWMLLSGECVGFDVDPTFAPGIPYVIHFLGNYGYEAVLLHHNKIPALKIRFR